MINIPFIKNVTINLTNTGYEGILDTLDIVGNCVLGFALKRLTGNYEGYCMKVQRTSDYAEQDFGFDENGDLDSSAIESFCGAGDGLVTTWYNQLSIGNDAYQTSASYKPKIVQSGSFLNDGLNFDGTNDYFTIDNYNEINSSTYPFTWYCTFKSIDTTTRYIFCKFGIQYSFRQTSKISIILDGSAKASVSNDIGNINNVISNWNGYNSNEVSIKNDTDEDDGIMSTQLTKLDREIYIGSYYQTSNNFLGNIKTFLIFNSNEYDNYSNFVDGGI